MHMLATSDSPTKSDTEFYRTFNSWELSLSATKCRIKAESKSILFFISTV